MTHETPTLGSDGFTTRDGLKLGVQYWEVEKPKAVIVALHGMNDYANAFKLPAEKWLKMGISTYAFDQRGFGRSPPLGLWPGSEAMQNDLYDFVDVVRERNPGVKVFAVGESMGGAVILTALASQNPPRVNGAVLVAPAVWSRAEMPLHYRVVLWTAAHTVPWLKLGGSGLNIKPSDNIEMLRRLAHDPLLLKKTRVDAIYGLVNLMDEAYHAPEKIEQPPPMLFLYGGKDQVVPAGPTEVVVKALGSKAEVKRYPNGFHMLLRDLGAEAVLRDVGNWVTK